jgi:hypothetical protein
MLGLFKVIWRRWKGFAHLLIKAQNWILMALVYWGAVAPVAIMMKLSRRPLLDRSLGDEGAESFWIPREDGAYTMDRSKHMS